MAASLSSLLVVSNDCRIATPEALLHVCHEALARLRHLAIKHGSINKHNSLMHDEKVTLFDFDSASQDAKQANPSDELRDLEN